MVPFLHDCWMPAKSIFFSHCCSSHRARAWSWYTRVPLTRSRPNLLSQLLDPFQSAFHVSAGLLWQAAQLEQAPLMILGDIPTLLYSGSAINRLKLIPPNSSRGETPEQAARPGLPGDLAIFFEFNHCVAH